MVTRRANTVQVSSQPTLDALRRGLSNYAGERIDIEVPSDALVLASAKELQQLLDAATEAGVSVELVTDDPLRRACAYLVGFPVGDTSPTVATLERSARSELPTQALRRVAAHQSETRPSVSRPGPSSDEDRQAENEVPEEPADDPGQNARHRLGELPRITDDYSHASFSFVVVPPRPDEPLARPDGRRSGVRPPIAEPAAWERGRTLDRSRGRRVAVVSLLASAGVVGAVVVLLIGFLAPYASATLVPVTTTIQSELRYGLAGSAPNLGLEFQPTPISTTVRYEQTIPTTGERFVPIGLASGELLLTNPTTTEIFVAAGTVVVGANEVSYETTLDVTVPAADPFGSLTLGSTTVTIQSTLAGPDGNADAGAINGQLESEVFYQNREAVEGGSLQQIQTVTQADLDRLADQARQALAAEASPMIIALVPEGQSLVEGSITTGEPVLEYNQSAGADAAELTIRASLPVSASVFDPAAMHAQAEAAVGQALTEQTPDGSVLLGSSVQISQPTPISGAEEQTFSITASGTARAMIDPEEVEAVRRQIVGKSEAGADRLISEIPGVATYSLEWGPDWLPFGQTPRLDSRVTVEVANDQAAQAASSGEETTGP